MNIIIKTILHNEQRYPTCGDWWLDKKGDLQIRVSSLGDPYMEYLVASHELREFMVCKRRGITQKQVDAFDIQYEKDRARGKYTLDQEPGNDPDAPYTRPHRYATAVEMIDAEILGVDWPDYNNKVMSL